MLHDMLITLAFGVSSVMLGCPMRACLGIGTLPAAGFFWTGGGCTNAREEGFETYRTLLPSFNSSLSLNLFAFSAAFFLRRALS